MKISLIKLDDFLHKIHLLVPSCIYEDHGNIKTKPNFVDRNYHHHRESKKFEFIVHRLHQLLLTYNHDRETSIKASKKKYSNDLSLKLAIEKIHEILYGNTEFLPDEKACAELAVELFREIATCDQHPVRLLITRFPDLETETRTFVSEIITKLLAQSIDSRMIASDFFQHNLDLIDVFVKGSFDFSEPKNALLYGSMLRVLIERNKAVTMHVLVSKTYMKKFLEEVKNSDFTIAASIISTFEILLTKHYFTVAEFLTNNSDWFFDEFNSKLLESSPSSSPSSNLILRFHALRILEKMLLCLRHDHVAMVSFLKKEQIMKTVMNLFRELDQSSESAKQKGVMYPGEKDKGSFKKAKRSAFNIFKLFVDDPTQSESVAKILVLNKAKICRFLLEKLEYEEDDDEMVKDLLQVIKEIESLVL